MTSQPGQPLTFWSTVRLLLGAARKRAAGRRKRQQELLRQRTGKDSTNWAGLGVALTVFFMAMLNCLAAFVVITAVDSGERLEAERRGKIVVSRWFLDAAKAAETVPEEPLSNCFVDNGHTLCLQVLDRAPAPSPDYASEAKRIAEEYGGSRAAIEQKLRDAVRDHRTGDFITKNEAAPGIADLPKAGRFPAMLGSLMLLLWGVMLVFQGEGLELDVQRRRHPMWEWLFSHPVPPGAVFFAEMLSPIASNPMYWTAPLFAGVMYGAVYDPWLGALAALVIGIPISLAAACMGKALEIAVILRFPSRSRGAMIGFMSWIGYASLMAFFLGLTILPRVIAAASKFLYAFTVMPWPWLRLFLGGLANGSYSFLTGMFTCWIVAGTTAASAIAFSVWGAQQGLSGNFGRADSAPSVSQNAGIGFGKDPLYRKELLWFARDRSAIVQTILIPLTVAGFQLFNMRGLLSHAQSAWNYLCGVGILFGTYFLWILGPKSLASEGAALWIALTWPRGLESLLKAKAWLWSLLSSGIVAMILCYAAFLFPVSIWKILLVGIGWFIFARSMAEKSVTLVTVTSSSGEPEQIPKGRRWAAQLGMLTFAIGIFTQQWQLAVIGIVYSYLTAAAMWENFRARLPYLYDPWSEKLPPPPTLMHAMVAISILVEGVAVLTGILLAAAGRENIAIAQAFSYGICAVIVSIGVSSFLGNRGVSQRDVWRWPSVIGRTVPWWRGDDSRQGAVLLLFLVGVVGGLALGLFAHGYLFVLQHIPATAELIRKGQEQMAKIPYLRISYFVMAVGFAPIAEEYLFRGLLFRALDREWGGWRAIVGSAAFFAIYHPALSWLPVAMLGMTNALLFKKTGRLAPAVVLHMVYNAVVLS